MKISIVLLLIAAFIYTQMPVDILPGESADSRETYTFQVETPSNLEVQLAAGQIEVLSHDKSEIRVEQYLRGRSSVISDHNLNIEVEKVDNTVYVNVETTDRRWLSSRHPRISYKIFVPIETSSSLRTSGGSISVQDVNGETIMRTSGGSLSLERVTGNIRARTSGGSIRADRVEGVLAAHTSGGSIRVSGFTGELDCRTSGGGITLDDVDGKITARTSGGNVRASIPNYIESLDLRTSGGNISAIVPKNLDLDLDLRGSRVNTSLSNFSGTSERNRVVGKMNNGGIPVAMRTSGGNVRLDYR